MRLREWCTKHGFSYQAGWNMFKAGKLPNAEQLPSGSIIVHEAENKEAKPDCAYVYARVSNSTRRTTDLVAQAKRLRKFTVAYGLPVAGVVKEVGSGLNDKRPQLLKLLKRKDVTHIIVEHKDRLARFGVSYIELLCKEKGIKLIIVNETDTCEKELMQDFVSLVTSFCARLYGLRRSHRKTEQLIERLKTHAN